MAKRKRPTVSSDLCLQFMREMGLPLTQAAWLEFNGIPYPPTAEMHAEVPDEIREPIYSEPITEEKLSSKEFMH